MSKTQKRLCWLALIVFSVTLVGCRSKESEEEAVQRPNLSPTRSVDLLKRVVTAQTFVDKGQRRQTKRAYAAIEKDFPELVEFDLGLFSKAEVYLARPKRTKAVKKYKTLTEDYPQSELVGASQKRLYSIGRYYLDGPVIANLLLFKIRGHSRGIRILEDLTEELGMEDPNGMGTQATIAIAENLEARGKVQDAYLKWLELATAWDAGPLGKMALLGMARTKLAAYKIPAEHRRVYYDGGHLVNSRNYYAQFAREYPADANELGVAKIIAEIDVMMAAKQLTIAEYYERTGKTRAANLYYDMVAQNWPTTPSAQAARDKLAQNK